MLVAIQNLCLFEVALFDLLETPVVLSFKLPFGVHILLWDAHLICKYGHIW